MNVEKFKEVYDLSRNGANCFYYHWAVRSFEYSDGVKDLAETGCYWLLDILATEMPQKMRAAKLVNAALVVKVANSKATITLQDGDDAVWLRKVDYTDMPEGRWTFHVADEGRRIAMILPKEY